MATEGLHKDAFERVRDENEQRCVVPANYVMSIGRYKDII